MNRLEGMEIRGKRRSHSGRAEFVRNRCRASVGAARNWQRIRKLKLKREDVLPGFNRMLVIAFALEERPVMGEEYMTVVTLSSMAANTN